MLIVFHERFKEVYSNDFASKLGRLDSACQELGRCFDFIKPVRAIDLDLELVHSPDHIEQIKKSSLTYEIAALAAGGAIKAAELTTLGKNAFALIRPPGHHASKDRKWGFCFFNNVAVAVEKLRNEGVIKKALIIDIDLHFGDGTNKIFKDNSNVTYIHINELERNIYLERLQTILDVHRESDLIAVSAGFDTHEYDWGFLLRTEDYNVMGKMIKSCADRICEGRVFGVLEGGYNQNYLGENIKSFLFGLEGRNYTSRPVEIPLLGR